ncbi:unnamed protein product [Clonostachys chloroleuca]|uniref:Amine oxidase n=1 Tax=Clonostachys chloroleuca TaxID=1926264 RepID=A0AA35LRI9_9HYPO|nr:unnamed protein product [Clonostachys chloroleuca]
MVYSSEGFTWTPSGGIRHGLPTIGAVDPPTFFASSKDQVYDVIVVGAGYAGLVASRDLATQGKKTLLVEARDRLGGRTWHSTINGFNYEMGGTWIHWHMPHIYREVSHYGLQDDWVVTQVPGGKEDYCTLTTGDQQRNISHEEEADLCGRVFRIFCNLDGNDLREKWKYVFGTKLDPQFAAKWDNLSCSDRLNQIRNQLSPEELAALEAQLIQMGGNSPDKIGFLNALLWWSLGSHTGTGLNEIALHTRLASGQSELHRRIFEHAASTGNLSYAFGYPVKSVQDKKGLVTVTARDGSAWKARSVICTVPLNVLADVQFSPSLPVEKVEASKMGTANLCNKVHIDVQGPDYLSWGSLASPGKGLVSAFADQLTPADNTHLVSFGPDPKSSLGIKLNNIDRIISAFKHLLPAEKRDEVLVNRIVAHDWNNDEFAKGTWLFAPPKLTTKYLEALQRPHGNVYFASADWSDGWRGWIDGGVQSGMEVARDVIQHQKVASNKSDGRTQNPRSQSKL